MKTQNRLFSVNGSNIAFAAALALTFTSGGVVIYLTGLSMLTERQDRILDSSQVILSVSATVLVALAGGRPKALGSHDDDQR